LERERELIEVADTDENGDILDQDDETATTTKKRKRA